MIFPELSYSSANIVNPLKTLINFFSVIRVGKKSTLEFLRYIIDKVVKSTSKLLEVSFVDSIFYIYVLLPT